MKNKVVIVALAAIFSLATISPVLHAEGAKIDEKASCKKQAKKMKFEHEKDKTAFLKECKKSKAKAKAAPAPKESK